MCKLCDPGQGSGNDLFGLIRMQMVRLLSLISKDLNNKIICTTDDVRGDFLGPPHGTTPAAVIANKNIKV